MTICIYCYNQIPPRFKSNMSGKRARNFTGEELELITSEGSKNVKLLTGTLEKVINVGGTIADF